MRNNKYRIQLDNFDSPLPLDIATENGKQKVMADKKGVVITSAILPVVDPDVFYLKRVIYE